MKGEAAEGRASLTKVLGEVPPAKELQERLLGNHLVGDAVELGTREEPPAILTTTQAGKILQVCSRTVVNMIERGELHAVRVGGAWRIPRSSLPGADRAA